MKTALRTALSLVVAAALIAALMAWGDVEPGFVRDTLLSLPASSLALAVALHAGVYALRAWRFALLVPPASRPRFGAAATVAAAHNLAAYVLPAKTGEAAFVVYLKAVAGVSAARGLASLVVSRILDLAVLCLGFATACAWIGLGGGSSEIAPATFYGFALGLLVPGLLFAYLSARSHVVVPLAQRVLRAVGLERRALGRRILERSESVREALRSSGGEGRVLAALALSLPLWLGVFAFYAVLARGMGLDEHGLADVTFGSGVAVMFNLLPVNGLAGFGTQEAGWTFGFGLLGVSRDTALATGLGAHVVQLVDVCVFGLVAHAVMGARGSRPAGGAADGVD